MAMDINDFGLEQEAFGFDIGGLIQNIKENIKPEQLQGIAKGVGGVVDIFRRKKKSKKNQRQSSPPPPPPPPYRPPVNYERKGSNKTLLYVGIGVGVLAIGVITILLVRNK